MSLGKKLREKHENLRLRWRVRKLKLEACKLDLAGTRGPDPGPEVGETCIQSSHKGICTLLNPPVPFRVNLTPFNV